MNPTEERFDADAVMAMMASTLTVALITAWYGFSAF
jgi:hypothetical protein